MSTISKTTFSLFALATTFFGIGITEFIGVGILPAISSEFSVSISTAGLIVSLYALGVAIGGIVLTSLTSRIARKKVLLSSILLFIIGHILTAFAESFPLLLGGRIVSSAAHGLFFSLASAIAVSLVAPNKAASAIAFIFSGFTVATAFAAPLGTYISDIAGWRIPFFAIAVVGIIALILNYIAIPADKLKIMTPPSFRDQFHLVTNGHVLLMLVVTILGYGGTFAAFTYLSPILQEIMHIDASYVSAVLVMYGITIAIGNHLGGRFGNTNSLKILLYIFSVQGIVLLLFYFTASYIIFGLITIAAMGFMAFMSVPILQSYIMLLAKRHVPSATDLASSLNIASFNGGIAVGSGLGGFVIDTIGIAYTPLVAAAMVAFSILLTIVSIRMDKVESLEEPLTWQINNCIE